MSSENKWVYSYNEDAFVFSDEFETKEEAIKYAKEEAMKHPDLGEHVYVGKTQIVNTSGIDLDSVIENIAENTVCGFDGFGDDYLCNIKEEHYKELEESLNDVFFKWIEKYKYQPDWFSVIDIEKVKVK